MSRQMIYSEFHKVIHAHLKEQDLESMGMNFVFICPKCSKEVQSNVYTRGKHSPKCIWEYYLWCIECDTETPIAKMCVQKDKSNYPVLVDIGIRHYWPECKCPY